MNLMPFLSALLLARQLRKAKRFSWFCAIGIWAIIDDKASFDAIGAI